LHAAVHGQLINTETMQQLKARYEGLATPAR